jgi:hypothetical protein
MGLLKTIHCKQTAGFTITHPSGNKRFVIHGPGLIDDQMDLIGLPSNELSPHLPLITATLQLWQNLLNVTGGDLSRPKCAVAPLTYNFTPTRYGEASVKLFMIDESPGQIELQPFNQAELLTILRRLGPESAERYLGLHLNVNCTWTFEFHKRKDQMDKMARRIIDAAMKRHISYLIFQINYKPALSYPLHHTLFTDQQCDSIQSSFINAILPKMDFNRHMPRVVIFGPQIYGGVALADAKVEQTVFLVTDMITELQRSTLVGKQFNFLIANYQRYLGTAIPFLHQNPADYPYKPRNSRITFIWEKMYQNQITASSDTWWLPKTPLKNDLAIMDAFILGKKRLQGTPSNFTDTMMNNANSVRLYLRCTFLSDIVGPDKCSIAPWATVGGPPLLGSESYPAQTPPTDRMLQHWRQLLRSCFLTSTNLIANPPTITPPP